MNFMTFFGVASVVRNGNFFISLAVTLFWYIAALAAVFLVVDKRDVY